MILLSIISPFYNSRDKCTGLLHTLSLLNDPTVEVILVDDGSNDKTIELLHKFEMKSKVETKVIAQANKGAGGARNEGLRHASGKYVWFVDSDDDIRLEAIEFLKANHHKNFDVIDFNVCINGISHNSMDVQPGKYRSESGLRKVLMENFGRIWTKMFRRELLLKSSIRYPEYCYFEDNLLSFVFPFHVNSLLKTDLPSYDYSLETGYTHVTPNARFFDRMLTAKDGFALGKECAQNVVETDVLERLFIQLYLINAVGQIIKRLPGLSWITACRIMRHYRNDAADLGIVQDPFRALAGNRKFNTLFKFLWVCSFMLPDQRDYFWAKRMEGWNRDYQGLSSSFWERSGKKRGTTN